MSEFQPVVTVELDKAKEARLRALLHEAPRQFPAAVSRAINKTLTHSRAEVSKAIRGEVVLKAGKIKEAMRIKWATRSVTAGAIKLSRKPVPLKEYGARQVRHGVTAKVRLTKPRELHRHSFIIRKLGRHVFERLGQPSAPVPRFPIVKRFGPTLLGVFENVPGVETAVVSDAGEFFNRKVDEEVNFELIKLVRRR